jgi:murein tripeptide amidase MpaA
MNRERSIWTVGLLPLVILLGCNNGSTIELHTDFDGAAAEDLRTSRRGDIVFSLPDSPGSDERLWFYFRLAAESPVRPNFVIENPGAGHQHNWDVVRPVVSSDRVNWVRAEEAGLSNGPTVWSRIVARVLGRNPVFEFRSPVESRELWVAYAYPYTAENLDDFLGQIGTDDRVSVTTLGQSEQDRDIALVTITGRDADSSSDRSTIWVIGREHPGETPNSFVLEGLVNALLDETLGQQLLSRFRFKIVPMINVDGVANGHYYRNSKGIDLAKDWLYFNSREMQHLYRAMEPDLTSGSVALVLNLHSANAPLSHFFLETNSDWLPEDLARLQARFLENAADAHPQLQTEDTVETWDYPYIASNFLSNEHGVLCLYQESNYSVGADMTVVTQESLRDLGKAMTLVIADSMHE